VDFCAFQYGTLKSDPKNKPHQSYLKLLEYHGLSDRVSIDYEKPINSPKDKDKDKDKDTDTAKEKEMPKFEEFYAAYPNKKSRKDAEKAFNALKPNAELFAEMLAALENQKREREAKDKNGLFNPEWKYPASWIRAEAWKDETMTDEQIAAKKITKTATRTNGKQNGRTYAPNANEYAELAKQYGIGDPATDERAGAVPDPTVRQIRGGGGKDD